MLTAVVDTRSVNGAAEVLDMSQSGMSRAVARLEAPPIWCATAIQLPTELENGQHRCILFREPVTGRSFPWEFHQRKKRLIVKSQGTLTVNDPGPLYGTCLPGLGIAQLFELGFEQYIASGQLIRRFPLYAYYPSHHHVPAKTRALLDFLESLVR